MAAHGQWLCISETWVCHNKMLCCCLVTYASGKQWVSGQGQGSTCRKHQSTGRLCVSVLQWCCRLLESGGSGLRCRRSKQRNSKNTHRPSHHTHTLSLLIFLTLSLFLWSLRLFSCKLPPPSLFSTHLSFSISVFLSPSLHGQLWPGARSLAPTGWISSTSTGGPAMARAPSTLCLKKSTQLRYGTNTSEISNTSFLN